MPVKKHFADWNLARFDQWINYGFQFLGMWRPDNPTLFDNCKRLGTDVERKAAFAHYIDELKAQATEDLKKQTTLNNRYLVVVHKTNVAGFTKNELEAWLENPCVYLFFISGGGVDRANDLYDLKNENLIVYPNPLTHARMTGQYNNQVITGAIGYIEQRI